MSTWSPHAAMADELFGEQLRLAVELVGEGGAARERLALVSADNLAEVLLHHHVEATLLASDDLGPRLPVVRFDRRERARLRSGFDR